MGTSSGRRAPTGRLWRLAKGAATRYLSPEGGAALEARELAARYVEALSEGTGPAVNGALAAFRQTRKVAQNLGAFLCRGNTRDWPAALAAWGLTAAAAGPRTLALPLAAALETAGSGLEQAVNHAALMEVLLGLPEPGPSSPALEPAHLVQRFLAGACCARLALDLGEALEAAAPGFSSLRQGLQEIAACIGLAGEGGEAPAPPSPAEWLGLPGWTWVTRSLETLLLRLKNREA